MALTAKKVYAILKRQISDMEAKLNSPVRYRGTVATADLLPLNPDIGDMYNIESKSIYGEAGMNVAWNGVVWDTMGAPIDMSLYIKSSELADWAKQPQKPDYTAEEVGALPANTKIPSKTSDLQNDSGFLTKIPDNYLSGTDKTLSASGKAADAKATGDKITELSADISNKLNKNQGSENSGKIAGINESGDIVPMFPVSVDYNEETNCLEFGSDQKMELNKGINLDSTLTKTGYAADAGAVGEITNSLKEDISTKITKFYASSQGETHLADSDNGKIMDMMVYGKSEQKQYSGKNLLNATLQTTTQNGVTCTNNGDGTYTLNGTATDIAVFAVYYNFADVYGSASSLKMVGCPSGGSAQKYFLRSYRKGGNPEILDEYGSGISIGSFKEAESNIAILVKSGVTVNNLIFKPMLTTDTTATYADFEPYTGGIPSPNPDYPQEIKSVVNPTVKVCGKNLFKATLGNVTANGITCTANSDGTYILNGTCTVSTALSIIGIFNHILNEPLYLTGVPSGCGSYLALGRRDGDNILVTDGKNTKIDAGIHTDHIEFWITKGTTLNNVIFKPMLTTDPTVTYDDFEPYHEQTVVLPYTLNAIPVSSGGNVTIDGQQYIADYVDVERGKLVRMVGEFDTKDLTVFGRSETDGVYRGYFSDSMLRKFVAGNSFRTKLFDGESTPNAIRQYSVYMDKNNKGQWMNFICDSTYRETADLKSFIQNTGTVYGIFETSEEIDLTPEEIAAFKSLATYYPTTNISINSEQLDGYTVFNYPISMQNGWDYVKQQIGDTREYIYDMDARTQNTDLQAAEAYVNSEYAVALTELEV